MSLVTPPDLTLEQEEALDGQARQQAWQSTECSYIVQAPAGSGKTGLLTQRYLSLLAIVSEPEEVLAITFTRKAAAEMRERITSALRQSLKPAPQEAFLKTTWELARAALRHSEELHWSLFDNPGRLRIRTIDSLCQYLVRQMPVLSSFGAALTPSEQSDRLYLSAAGRTLQLLEGNSPYAPFVQKLLEQVGNSQLSAQSLLAEMLGSREQWMPLLNAEDSELLNIISRTLNESLEAFCPSLTQFFNTELLDQLLNAAGMAFETINLLVALPTEPENRFDVWQEQLSNSPEGQEHWKKQKPTAAVLESLYTLHRFRQSPHTSLELLSSPLEFTLEWQSLLRLTLTSDNKVFKTVRAAQCFLKQTPEKKLLMQALEDLADNVEDGVQGDMDQAKHIFKRARMISPELSYDKQWPIIKDFLQLVKVAIAQLTLCFQEKSECDFTEFSLRAIAALGPDEAPTELAYSLDYRIKHLLVDEYQDTSAPQYELLRRLTRSWQEGDGRTVFLVGDPMQSIYRFRNAEVGIFLKTRDQGLGQVKPRFLRLLKNFRSSQNMVSWFNTCFVRVFPQRESSNESAITYSPALSTKALSDYPAVEYHCIIQPAGSDTSDPTTNPKVQEALMVWDIIKQEQAEHPDHSITLLINSRSQASEIVRLLEERHEPYIGVNMFRLSSIPIIRDLLSLTRLILNPGDTVAALAVLRSACCGLSLHDLTLLTLQDSNEQVAHTNKPAQTLLEVLCNPQDIETRLASAADPRATELVLRLMTVMQGAWSSSGKQSLRRLVEGTWIGLGGPSSLSSEQELRYAQEYLALLDKYEGCGFYPPLSQINQDLEQQYATPLPTPGCRLQIMTIHGAKGLEFDTVIIPQLNSSTRGNGKRLVEYTEQLLNDRSSGLLLGPISSIDEENHPTSQWQKEIDSIINDNEAIRLLYVAATRAKYKLHLLATLKLASSKKGAANNDPQATNQLSSPQHKTLLKALWPFLGPKIQNALQPLPADPSEMDQESQKNSSLERLQYLLLEDKLPDQSAPQNLEQEDNRELEQEPPIIRLSRHWTRPEYPVLTIRRPFQEFGEDSPEPTVERKRYKASPAKVIVGVVYHRILASIGKTIARLAGTVPTEQQQAQLQQYLQSLKPGLSSWVQASLMEEGLQKAQSRRYCSLVLKALSITISSPNGLWLLSPEHSCSQFEYKISSQTATGQPSNNIIDRSFVDAEDNLWIVDYKTSQCSDQSDPQKQREFFAQEQSHYRPQLQQYACLMDSLCQQKYPIRLALYHPLMQDHLTSWQWIRPSRQS